MKKILLAVIAAFAITTVAPLMAHAADEAADGAKAEKPAKKGKKKAKKDGDEKTATPKAE